MIQKITLFFCLFVFICGLAAQDDCTSAVDLPFDPNDETALVFVEFADRTASDFSPDCENGTPPDVWYSFEMPFDGNINIDAAGSSNFTKAAIYSGSCGSLTTIVCGGDNTIAGNLTNGVTYYVQAWTILANQPVSFKLAAFPTTSNDNCGTADELLFDSNDETQVVAFVYGSLSSSGVSPDCLNGTPADVWHSFVMPFDGNIDIDPIGSVNFTNAAIYSGTCGALTTVACGGSTTFGYDLIGGVTYYVQAWVVFNGSQVNFRLSAHPTATNDECTDAEAIIFDSSDASAALVQYPGASLSGDLLGSCQGSGFHDVWFSMTSPITGTYRISDGASFNGAFVIYEQDDNNCFGAELHCFTSNFGDFNVVQGEKFIIRAFRNASETEYTLNLVPTITAVSEISAGSCVGSPSIPDISIDASNNSKWINILDNAGDIIGSINANGSNLGTVSTELLIDASDFITYNGGGPDVYFMRRTINITPTAQPVTPVSVRLYFTLDEFTDLSAIDNNLANTNDLSILKIADLSCSAVFAGEEGDFIDISISNHGLFARVAEFEVFSFSKFLTTSTESESALPIELTNFSASANTNSVTLDWTSASEVNNDGFHVQHSSNGRDWADISWVDGAGNSTKEYTYQYKHSKPLIGSNYYRLQQVDLDGQFEYGEIEHVQFNTATRLSVFPNPATGYIQLNTQVNKFSTVRILNSVGQLVREVGFTQGQEINVSSLEKGVYYLEIISDQEVETALFLKQ